jgi:bacterial/archaeal transporter family-2 protein
VLRQQTRRIKMNYIFGVLWAGITGILVAFEPAINGRLGKLTSPELAILHSSASGFVIVIIISILTGTVVKYPLVFKMPPYLLIGGLVGGGVIYFGAKASPILGIMSTVSIMISMQLITGIMIDNFGLFGVERIPLNITRIIGALFLFAGVQFIVRS